MAIRGSSVLVNREIANYVQKEPLACDQWLFLYVFITR
jgi:hypothetical protein